MVCLKHPIGERRPPYRMNSPMLFEKFFRSECFIALITLEPACILEERRVRPGLKRELTKEIKVHLDRLTNLVHDKDMLILCVLPGKPLLAYRTLDWL